MVFGRTCQKFLDLELLSLSLSLSLCFSNLALSLTHYTCCWSTCPSTRLCSALSCFTFTLHQYYVPLLIFPVFCTYLPTYLPTPTYLSTTYLYLYLSCCPFVYPILTLGHVFSFLLFSQTFHYFSTFFSFSKSAETFISISRAFNHSDVF